MRPKSSTPDTPSERLVRDIRRATRKQYSAEEKIRIVLDGLRGEVTIAELCRREGDWVAVVAVCGERVSREKPQITGNFRGFRGLKPPLEAVFMQYYSRLCDF